jgi:hypothetical protein
MREIKKIQVLSFAKIISLVCIFLGFILGIAVGFLSFVLGSVLGTFTFATLPISGAWLGIAGFVIVPVIFGIAGFILGLLSAWFYNLLAWWVGGIKIEISEEGEEED